MLAAMIKVAIVLALNVAFLAWVVGLIVRDPANVWKRRDRVAPPGDDWGGGDRPGDDRASDDKPAAPDAG